VQDQLALILLNEAGLEAFQARSLPRRAFMKNLARIWASYARFEAGVRAVF